MSRNIKDIYPTNSKLNEKETVSSNDQSFQKEERL